MDAPRSRPLGLNQNVKLIGSVGRLAPVKDLQTLLSAVQRAVDVNADVHLALIGDGPERSRLESLRDELGLASRVHFTGFLSELETVYPDLDCVVNSSINEGTPVALIEAMAAGVPVVATAVGGTPDLFRDGAFGTLVPPGDASALANALVETLEDCDASLARAREARIAVVEKYRNSGGYFHSEEPRNSNWALSSHPSSPESGDASLARAREARIAVVEKYRSERLIHDTETLYRELLLLKGITAKTPEFSPLRT